MDRSFAFGIETPSDMLAKLERELSRAATTTSDRETMVDAGTNFALTAWSLVDWVWRLRFEGDAAAQDALAASHPDLRGQNPTAGRFKECLTRSCPELAFCQDIATGFKHMVASPPPGRTATSVADVTARPTPIHTGQYEVDEEGTVGGGLPGGAGSVTGTSGYHLEIRDESMLN